MYKRQVLGVFGVAGDPVPDSLLTRIHTLKHLWHTKKVELWQTKDDGEPETPSDPEIGSTDAPVSASETPSDPEIGPTFELVLDGDENEGEDADGPPAVPEPVHTGNGWYRIEGVEGAHRGMDEALDAWKQEHG